MSFKPLIGFVFHLLIKYSVNVRPNLCTEDLKPLKSFTEVIQLVNDSYFVTDVDKYTVFENPDAPKLTQSISQIKYSGGRLSDHSFSMDIIFIIDVDEHCVNVEETLFAIDLSRAKKKPNKYTYYTNDSYIEPKFMGPDTDLGPLNTINEVMKIFDQGFKMVLFFQSFGLVVIKESDSALAYCTSHGWKARTNVLKGWPQSSKYIDTGFVDNDEGLLYLFESETLGNNGEHIRKYYHTCAYTLSTSQIDLKCTKKSMASLCLAETHETPNDDVFDMAVKVLIVLVVLIVIVFVVNLCLICRQTKDLNSTQNTLGPDNRSIAVKSKTTLANKPSKMNSNILKT